MEVAMALNFENYRMKDGRTSLSEQYFNPIFRDIDLRLGAMEDVQSQLDQVIAELQQYGLARIDTAIVPILNSINADLIVKQAEINAYLQGLNNATLAGSLTINGTLTANKATTGVPGLVKINGVATGNDPIVYQKVTIDGLITTINERLTALETAAVNTAVSLASLAARMTTAEDGVTDAAFNHKLIFLRGMNFGGNAQAIEGNDWQAYFTAGLTNVTVSSGSLSNGTESSPVASPTTSAPYNTVFSTNHFPSVAAADLSIEFPSLSAGTYQAQLWIYQPIAATPKQAFNVFAQNVLQFAFNMATSHAAGRNWEKIKVKQTLSSAGSLTIKLTPAGGAPAVRIAAVELFREDK
jgi:hypothetical protein